MYPDTLFVVRLLVCQRRRFLDDDVPNAKLEIGQPQTFTIIYHITWWLRCNSHSHLIYYIPNRMQNFNWVFKWNEVKMSFAFDPFLFWLLSNKKNWCLIINFMKLTTSNILNQQLLPIFWVSSKYLKQFCVILKVYHEFFFSRVCEQFWMKRQTYKQHFTTKIHFPYSEELLKLWQIFIILFMFFPVLCNAEVLICIGKNALLMECYSFGILQLNCFWINFDMTMNLDFGWKIMLPHTLNLNISTIDRNWVMQNVIKSIIVWQIQFAIEFSIIIYSWFENRSMLLQHKRY